MVIQLSLSAGLRRGFVLRNEGVVGQACGSRCGSGSDCAALYIFSQVTENTGGWRKIICISAAGFCVSCSLAEIPVSFSLPEVWCHLMMHLWWRRGCKTGLKGWCQHCVCVNRSQKLQHCLWAPVGAQLLSGPSVPQTDKSLPLWARTVFLCSCELHLRTFSPCFCPSLGMTSFLT